MFRELKSRYHLAAFTTSKAWIVELLMASALLTLVVSRALLGMLQELVDEVTAFPYERWAILSGLALDRGIRFRTFRRCCLAKPINRSGYD